ncbi:hypothetical protein [Aquipuribacter nitratireducens]|uniref:Uncharacterized protein n=1 Tax=Aquipuribacter nitratireducens TaxID=650104 RepID=A0ABW0GRR3_9MICO
MAGTDGTTDWTRAGTAVPRTLLRDWVVCGLVAATTRFVPVPLLDDAVQGRAVRESVRRTLREAGRTYPVETVAPLYERRGRGLLRTVAAAPLALALWPARKWVRVAGAVRGVPTDLARVLALGRCTYRVLERGGLPDLPDGPDGIEAARHAVRTEAAQVRAAFDETIDELDLRLVAAALQDALGGARGLSGALVDYARGRFDRDRREHDAPGGLDPGEDVDRGVDRVLAALRQPEVRRQVEELDRRLDERLAAPS